MRGMWTFLEPRLADLLQVSGAQLASVLPAAVLGTAVGSLLLRYKVKGVPDDFLALPAPLLVPIAALAGALSPICTLGTVPIILGMIRRGFPVSASITFLTSSSIVTPQMVFIAAGSVGPELATLQVVGGIALSVTIGLGLHLFRARIHFFREDLTQPTHGHCGHRQEGFWRILWRELRFVVLWLVAGVLVSAVLQVFVAPYITWDLFLGGSFAVTFASALVSIPTYACGGFALPVLGGLQSSGLHVSAILAVMVCGPAARIRSLAALGRIIRTRALAGYLALVMTFSIFYGLVCEAIWFR